MCQINYHRFRYPHIIMTPQKQNTFIAAEWFDAFNTKDLDRLLGLYHEDAHHYSPRLKLSRPETNGLIIGKSALRSWWGDAFMRLPSLHYTPISLTESEQRVFMEYIRKVDGEPNSQIAEVLEIRNGLIIASKVYNG